MSWMLTAIVPTRVVDGDSLLVSKWQKDTVRRHSPVIPENTGARRPFDADLDVNVLFIYVVKVSQDQVAFGFIKPNNSAGHCPVDPKCLPARRWVDTDQRVSALDILRTACRVLTIEIRMSRPIDSLFAIDQLAEVRRQLLVCSVSACPEGVATDRRHSVVVEVSDTSRLTFMDEVRVPSRRTAGLSKASSNLGCLKCWPDHAHPGDTRNLRHLGLSLT